MPASSKFILVLTVVLGVLSWSGCSDDNNSNPPPGGATSTAFKGVFSNGTENGSMNVTVNSTTLAGRSPVRLASTLAPRLTSRSVVTATGTIKLVGGGTVNLAGSYNDVSDSLNLLGTGYTFGGEYDTSGTFKSISGGYTGPSGNGFFGIVTGASTATAYCGTFASGSSGVSGTWDIVTEPNGQLGGIAFPTTGEPSAFEGTIQTAGTMRTLTAGFTDPGVSTLTVTGTLNTTNNTISGNWAYDDLVGSGDDSGTWSGNLCP